MTIDEAIKHCNEVASGALCKSTVNHKACGEEHKQLAEWLEELQGLKENTTENLGTHIEQFICSKCELHLENFAQQIYDEDEDETSSVDFEFLYCPGCGRKVE